ncbi:MAG: hypothetical protein AB7P03_04350 [Kofleriaceae bacterium]
MAKRSPILGYNHNVRYRGVVFHVQTEDSGMLSPHLFTHLFHGGVIISTRKLVYDSGSAEEAIKSLMQAQHKAVLKDLRKGKFDDKIDQYLGGTEGLLPRDAEDPGEAVAIPAGGDLARASAPDLKVIPEPPPPAPPRTTTPQRVSPPPRVKGTTTPPIKTELEAPTLVDEIGVIADAISSTGGNATIKTAMPTSFDSSPEITIQHDSAPVEITEDRRVARPTDPYGLRRMPGAPGAPPERRSGSAIGAAALPPSAPIARPPTRPPPGTPAAPRTGTTDGGRSRRESEAVQVYSPPPSPDDRPGEYSQHKRVTSQERAASPVPSGLARPGRASSMTPAQQRPNEPLEPPELIRQQPPPRPTDHPRPREAPEMAARPAERPHSQTGRPMGSRSPSSASGGVVMTRPAVIVGAPAKQSTPPRVRKAREEEGRGFGSGLISEKSLDEVILAYLSEDAEDK